jgi:WhiB family redox-sensing transcriptional regulator
VTTVWALAACLRYDPDWWFPSSKAGDSPVHAKRVCHGCPVRQACEDYAVPRAELHGIWGGLSPLERARLRGDREVPGVDECVCGCFEVEHRTVFRVGRRSRGACRLCPCSGYERADG